ncbi:MAG: VWA domain-containing protein [Gaiellales bacterium]
MIRFEWPLALLALLLVPLSLGTFVAVGRRRARYLVRYTNVEVLATVVGSERARAAYLPGVCVVLATSCALAAVARPQVRYPSTSERTSIVLAMDTSGSMAADDVRPTRLAAADQALQHFLTALPRRFRVGLVTFSDKAHVATPLTQDRSRVLEALAWSNDPASGTAIGDALARSLELLAAPDPGDGPSAIVLLSDGAQTTGTLSPLAAAARARSDGIRVDTVALGTPKGIVWEGVIPLAVPPDRRVLRQIARSTGGASFAPTDEGRLDAVYERLARTLGRTRSWHELGSWLEGLAALFALTGGALSLVGRERLP